MLQLRRGHIPLLIIIHSTTLVRNPQYIYITTSHLAIMRQYLTLTTFVKSYLSITKMMQFLFILYSQIFLSSIIIEDKIIEEIYKEYKMDVLQYPTLPSLAFATY